MSAMYARVLRSLLAAGLIGTLACNGNEPIDIGVAGPLAHEHGQSMRRAAELAVREINRVGGVRGRELRLVFADDSGTANAATRIAQEFSRNREMMAVVGHLTSEAMLAAAPIYNAAKRPLVAVSPTAASPDITHAGPFVFRVCPSELAHGQALAEWARTELKANRAAVLYLNDHYGRSAKNTFVASFEDQGGVVTAAEPFLPELGTLEPLVSHIQSRGGADALYIAGVHPATGRIALIADSLGLTTRILGSDAITGFPETETDVAEGVVISTAYLPEKSSPANRAFVDAYAAAYGGRVPDHRAAGTYDIVHLLARAIEEIGPDRDALQQYLAGVGIDRPPYEGVTGTIAFDENGDVQGRQVALGRTFEGRLVGIVDR